ncbi:hypothetical protein [Nocardia sp. NPDC006630]|uniref:hypothetical protein n=1 Tax=Nocardia sp. NPDC006630 TaxID=3157181 RepID=UPI0033BA4706
MTRTLRTASIAALLTALAGPTLLAGPAAADITDVSVVGVTPGSQCTVTDGCTIIAGVSGNNRYDQVQFLINGAVVGSATPVANSGVVTATFAWHPTSPGPVMVGATQGTSSSAVSYLVGGGGSACSWLPSGSAGSGSASGSGGSGSSSLSGGTGSAGSGSAGSGSAGSGSAC